MNDDFNTPVLIANLFEAVKLINLVKDGKASLSLSDKELLQTSLYAFVFDVLGLTNEDNTENSDKLDGVVAMLISMRNDARANKDWALSDRIRDELMDLGIQLKDGKDGTSYSIVT
jgi:cysteinyl-tRNA synthetase